MALLKITDWLQQHNESSPFTRLRDAQKKGLAAGIPDAGMNAHSTYTGTPGDKKLKKSKKIKYKLPPE